MSIIVDIILISLLIYAAYSGTKRGFVLIGVELIGFIIATIIALITYAPIGAQLRTVTHLPSFLNNVAGFVLVWVIVEVTCSLIARFAILRHLTRSVQLSRANQAGGAVLNAIKSTVMISLILIVFASLPLSADIKQIVTSAHLPRTLLASTGQLTGWLSTGIGRDIGASLNFFTVTPNPESEQRIDLGYTTGGTIDAANEDAMLKLINRERTSRGLQPLTMNESARSVARTYSLDMFARGYFSHINPEGKSPFDRMKAGNVRFNAAGENLALAPTLQLAHQGLMNSPGHRANILSPDYHTVGIGVIDGGVYGLMITQNFTD